MNQEIITKVSQELNIPVEELTGKLHEVHNQIYKKIF